MQVAPYSPPPHINPRTPLLGFARPTNHVLFPEFISKLIGFSGNASRDAIRFTAKNNIPSIVTWPCNRPLSLKNIAKLPPTLTELNLVTVENPPINSVHYICNEFQNTLRLFYLKIPATYKLNEVLSILDKILELPFLEELHIEIGTSLIPPKQSSIPPEVESILHKLVMKSYHLSRLSIKLNIPNLLDSKSWLILKQLKNLTSFYLDSEGALLGQINNERPPLFLGGSWKRIERQSDSTFQYNMLRELQSYLIPLVIQNTSSLETLTLNNNLKLDDELWMALYYFTDKCAINNIYLGGGIRTSTFADTIPSFSNLHTIHMHKSNDEEIEVLKNLTNLIKLTITNSITTRIDPLIQTLSSNKKLKSLTLRDITILFIEPLLLLLRYIPRVIHLYLDNCRGSDNDDSTTVTFRNPILVDRKLSIEKLLVNQDVNLSHLQFISLSNYKRGIDSRSLRLLINLVNKGKLPNLKMLSLKDCGQFYKFTQVLCIASTAQELSYKIWIILKKIDLVLYSQSLTNCCLVVGDA